MKKNIIIGTAKFGLPYGLNQNKKKLKKKDIFKLLDFAKKNGISSIDTAINYGESEKVLGEFGMHNWRVITKLPTIKESNILELIFNSLKNLKIEKIDTLLFHDPKQMISSKGKSIFDEVIQIKKCGLVKKIGFSVYSPIEIRKILNKFEFDVLQCPYNIIDRRVEKSGILKILRKKKIEIHARSIFLKGLLLINQKKIPKKFQKWQNIWRNWYNFLEKNNLSPTDACANFAFSNKFIDKFVIGFDNYKQISNLINFRKKKKIKFPKDLQTSNTSLINPSNW